MVSKEFALTTHSGSHDPLTCIKMAVPPPQHHLGNKPILSADSALKKKSISQKVQCHLFPIWPSLPRDSDVNMKPKRVGYAIMSHLNQTDSNSLTLH